METNGNRLVFCDANGTLKQIIDVLSGKNGRLWLKGISAYVQQGAIKAFGWKTSKPVRLRSFESFEILMAVAEHRKTQENLFQSHNALNILQQLSFPIPEETVTFIALSVKDLGFDGRTKVSAIKECLPSLDLELCRDSDSAQLWLTNDSDAKSFLVAETTRITGRALIVPGKMFHVEDSHEDKIPFLSQVYFVSDGIMYAGFNDKVSCKNECDEDFDFLPQDKLLFRVKK